MTWEIDLSTGTPILVYEKCSVIQDEQAHQALRAITDEPGLRAQLTQAQQGLGDGVTRPHDCPENCPTYHDGCNCTVEVLIHNMDRAEEAEARVAEMKEAEQAWVKTWILLLREVSKLSPFADDWSGAADSDLLEEFDPWEVLRGLQSATHR